MTQPIPDALLARARRAKVGLEVGAGARFETALTLAAAAPQAEWWVTDVDPRIVRAPPPPLRAVVLDVFEPQAMPPADLVYAVRVPEELQAGAFALARRLRADLALRPLKDEWAELGPARHVVWPGGWRYWPID